MSGISGRTKLTSRIPDLQVEWATDHHELSVRQFLIEKKRFTDRQYRFILSRAPISGWETVATEIKNELSTEKIRQHIDEIVRVLKLSGKVANLMFTRAYKQLQGTGSDLNPSELLALTTAMERSQRIFIKSMGPETYRAATPFAKAEQFSRQPEQPEPTKQSNGVKVQFTYEETLEMIELKREFNIRMSNILEKAKQRTSTGGEQTRSMDCEFTCLERQSIAR